MLITQGKTNIKYLLIVVILAAIVGGGIFIYQYWLLPQMQTISFEKLLPNPSPTPIEFPTEANTYSILVNETLPLEGPIYYKIDTAEFKIKQGKWGTSEVSDFGHFEVYNNGQQIYSSGLIYYIEGVFAFEYNNNKYVIISTWKGGNNPITPHYVFDLNENKELKFIQELSGFAYGGERIGPNDLVIKNGKLYLRVLDDRFKYFYTDHAGSYDLNQYLLFDGDKLVNSDNEFRAEYLQEAEVCVGKLATNYQEHQSEKQLSYEFAWAGDLVCKVINYILADEEQKAWEDFDHYIPESIEPNYIKQEIIDIMKQPPERF